jgi:GntR family transcriptional regulator
MMARKDSLNHITPVVTDNRPLAARLADLLREAIADGRFGRGEQLPSEEQLSASYRVGRTTVREALKELESEGAVQVRRGRGRFVSSAPPVFRPITKLESVTEMLAAQGYTVANRVLSVQTRKPTADERDQLGLGEDASVVQLERLRLAQDEPLIYSVDILPAELVPESLTQAWGESLFVHLEQAGLTPTSSASIFRASHLPESVQELTKPGLDPFLPWLLMVQVHLAGDGTPVLYSHDYYRGDRFSFEVLRRVEAKSRTI